jgi:hypothetical protein
MKKILFFIRHRILALVQLAFVFIIFGFCLDVSHVIAAITEQFFHNAMINPSLLKGNLVILFTNARDEKNIKEWAAHHLLLGFDLVYIFDHKSEKPLMNEFKNFDTRVIIERCEWENPVKLPLMEKAAAIGKRLKASWMIYLDADEFLILNNFTDVKSLLNTFPHADSLGINWLLFGSNHHVNEPAGLILDNYTTSELILNHHVKSFVRPSQITKSVNPHYYRIKDSTKMFSINNKRINSEPHFNEWNVEYFKSPAYLAHYLYQSEETYLRRKVNLPSDDLGQFRDKIPNIHIYCNDIENLGPKEKYASQVKLFLMLRS